MDAVYIALPNSMHAEYTIRAARAGVHVLCEKPMAVTADECEAMIDACREHRVKLMIAYRLHFEEINLEVIDLVRQRPHRRPEVLQLVVLADRPARTTSAPKREMGGGTLYDIGVYCINAARAPVSRRAEGSHGDLRQQRRRRSSREIDESTGALLRFDGERRRGVRDQLQCRRCRRRTASSAPRASSTSIPAYEYAEGAGYELTVNGKTTRKRIGKRDQFAPELLYFSDCIRRNREPEPSGEEGLQDVRIVQALYESADTGKAVDDSAVPSRRNGRSGRQRITRPRIEAALVKAKSASEG